MAIAASYAGTGIRKLFVKGSLTCLFVLWVLLSEKTRKQVTGLNLVFI